MDFAPLCPNDKEAPHRYELSITRNGGGANALSQILNIQSTMPNELIGTAIYRTYRPQEDPQRTAYGVGSEMTQRFGKAMSGDQVRML